MTATVTATQPKYGVALVCANGHVHSDGGILESAEAVNFCQRCGGRIIDACPACKSFIRGMTEFGQAFRRPDYCPNCGKPYPWTAAEGRQTRKAIRSLAALSPAEQRTLAKDLETVATGKPEAPAARGRARELLKKVGSQAADGVTSLVSETIARTIKALLTG